MRLEFIQEPQTASNVYRFFPVELIYEAPSRYAPVKVKDERGIESMYQALTFDYPRFSCQNKRLAVTLITRVNEVMLYRCIWRGIVSGKHINGNRRFKELHRYSGQGNE